MIDYIFDNIGDDLSGLIKTLAQTICKENNINYNKQNYKVLLSNEKLFAKNNNVKFTSGSKKYLCFYGKAYLDNKGSIVENIHLPDGLVTIKPQNNSLLIMCGGIENSTVVENTEELLHFYVAPSHMLELQDPKLWRFL
jgi:hypothetical protein